MRKQIKPSLEIGDVNYVKPGEFFVTLSDDGKTPTSVQRRKDNLDMETILGQGGGSDAENVIELTSEEISHLLEDGMVPLPDMTTSWVNNVQSNYYEVVIKNTSNNTEIHYPLWDIPTLDRWESLGGDATEALSICDLVFGESFTEGNDNDHKNTYGIMYINESDFTGYLLYNFGGALGSRLAGFTPTPYFYTVETDLDDINHWVHGAAEQSFTEIEDVLSSWAGLYLEGGVSSHWDGVMFPDGHFYPKYSWDCSQYARNILNISTAGEEGMVYLGNVYQNGNKWTPDGQQYAIVYNRGNASAPIKMLDITGWGAYDGNTGPLL